MRLLSHGKCSELKLNSENLNLCYIVFSLGIFSRNLCGVYDTDSNVSEINIILPG